jgi:pimeloyl-ACP methyl ester carboxylesterase
MGIEYSPLPWLAGGLITCLFAIWLLRRWIHQGLAPQRIAETRSPDDVGLAHMAVHIPTANQKTLFGWWIPIAGNSSAPTAIVIHGWGGNAETMLLLAPPLQAAGIAVLLIDARCHGRSDEDNFTSLPRFAEDLEGSIAWLRQQAGGEALSITLIGHSVGAGAALLAASRRKDIAAVVSIAAFTHPVAMMRRWFAAMKIPYLPVGWLILRYIQRVIGYRFDNIAPANTISRVSCPVLLIHGEQDNTVPVSEAHAIYAARTGDHVQLKTIAGSHDDFSKLEDIEAELEALAGFLVTAVKARPV